MKTINWSERNADFFADVHEVVRHVPRGRVTTYGAIARFLGSPSASRTVGWAMNNAHGAKIWVPAHRVVNRNGYLTGKAHFGYPERMKELLEAEDVTVRNDRVLHFDSLFWDPSEALTL